MLTNNINCGFIILYPIFLIFISPVAGRDSPVEYLESGGPNSKINFQTCRRYGGRSHGTVYTIHGHMYIWIVLLCLCTNLFLVGAYYLPITKFA